MRNYAPILVFGMLIAILMSAGCNAPQKDSGTYQVPVTVKGSGPAIFEFVSHGGSHTFHVTSTGDHAGMIITVEGTKRNSNGEQKYGKIVNDPFAPSNVDVTKRISGFAPDTYTITISTINDNAPWSISIS